MKISISDMYYLTEGIIIITSFALYSLKEKREKSTLNILAEVIFLLSFSVITAILCYNLLYVAFIIYSATLILLYLSDTFYYETSTIYILASHGIIISSFFGSLVTSLYIVLAMTYGNAIMLTIFWKKLRYSKEITLSIFPIELALLSLISATDPVISTIMLPLTLLIELFITTKIFPNSICVFNIMLSYTIITIISPSSVSIVFTLLMLIPLSVHACTKSVYIILLDAPNLLYIIIYANVLPYYFLFIPSTIFGLEVLKDALVHPKKTTYKHLEALFRYIVILVCLIITAAIEGTILLCWPIIYLGLLCALSWIMDKKYGIEKYSHYYVYSELLLATFVFFLFGLKIETTIILAISGFLSIYGGIIINRKNVRLAGILTLIIVLVKATYDIIIQVTIMEISLVLKVTVSLLLIGLLLIGVSYLYLKFYKVSMSTGSE